MPAFVTTPQFLAALLVIGALAGCANVDDTTGERAGTGAAVGAASGAAIGILTGDFLTRTVQGAAVGAAGGFIYDQVKKETDD